MSTPTIDYDALAQQHGGSATVDYDALAAQHGAVAAQSAQSSALDPKGGWNVGDVLRGAASGIKNMVMHPLDTGAAMVQGALASGMSPTGEGYPSTAATGRPEDLQANQQVQAQAQQGQADQAKFIGQNPAYAAGGVIGPALATAGAAKVAPMILGGAGDLAGRAALLGKTPEGAYESALKPSTTLSAPERAAIVQTGLKNEIPVSPAGVEKIGDLIDGLNQQIKAQIAVDPNRPISTVPAIQNLKDIQAKFANQVTPQPDQADIANVQQNFLANPRVQPAGGIGPGPGSLGAADAQAMKQGTYQALGSKAYGEVKGASIEAQKALARGLKEEIANQFPEIGNLNADESRLLDLQPVLEKAVNRISNHQLIGIGTPVAGAATQAVTGSGGAGVVAAVLKSVLDNPNVKSRLAISISKAQKVPFSQASAQVQAYSTALGASAGASSSGAGSANQESPQ